LPVGLHLQFLLSTPDRLLHMCPAPPKVTTIRAPDLLSELLASVSDHRLPPSPKAIGVMAFDQYQVITQRRMQ
jgi:hypothetical protein